MFVVLFLLSLGLLLGTGNASNIGTFDDRKCSASVDNLSGPNGYPNGTCTPLNIQTNQSFQIVDLDPGCAVTLYGPDSTSDPCSSETLIVGRIATCYNSTWNYYSIDGCNIPSIKPSPTPLIKTSSTSTLPPSASSTSSRSSTSTASAASASTSPSSAPTLEKSNHLPLIIGASLGGVGVIALLAILVLLFVRYGRSKKHRPEPPSYELSNDHALLEAARGEKVVQTELWAHDTVQEIGRNSVHVPPVELAGDALPSEDKKNIGPLIKVHMVR